jgi:hypothetical protein
MKNGNSAEINVNLERVVSFGVDQPTSTTQGDDMIRTTFLSAAALSLALVAPAYAQMGAVDMDRVKEKMGDAGIEERRDFTGTLMRAQTEDGQTLFMLVSPRDLGANGEIEVSEADLRERFEDAGFSNVQVVDQAEFAVGNLDDDKSIIVMRAMDVRADGVRTGATPEPAATGTIAPQPPTGPLPGADVPGASPTDTPGLPGTTVPAVPGTGATPGGATGAAPMAPGTAPGTVPGGAPGAGGTIQ